MILLTGATGYLGSQIARELAARGIQFRVLVRDPARLTSESGIQNPESPGAPHVADGAKGRSGPEVVTGDLRDPESLRRALDGADRVIHAAALVKMWVRDRREFWRVNVEGLKTLLATAEQAGVSRLLYTSSFIALGPSDDPAAGEGLCHAGPYSNEYEETKARALDWLRREGFARYPVIALLPGVIYGPGPRTEGNLVGGMIAQYLAGKFPGLLGSGNQRWSFSLNTDVVAAHLSALDRGTPGQEYVLGGDNRSLSDLFRLIAELSGVRHRVRRLPFVAGKMVGGIELAKARLLGRSPQLTPGVVEVFKHNWVYSSRKAVTELGYRVTPLEDGLRITLGAIRALEPEPRKS